MLNTFLAEQLRSKDPGKPLKLLLEFESQEFASEIKNRFAEVSNIIVNSPIFNFLSVEALTDFIPSFEQFSLNVHYDMPRSIFTPPLKRDPLLGLFAPSEITIPFSPTEMALRTVRNAPFTLLAVPSAIGAAFGLKTPRIAEPNVIIVPTSETRLLMKPPVDNRLRHTKVAVLDTGLTIPHPQFNVLSTRPTIRSTTGEPGLDGLGHGQWCTTCAFGGSVNTRFGRLNGVATANSDLMHVKCLSNLGFGSTSSILKAMEIALSWGARVISMSLGGPLQGSVEEDPECKIIQDHPESIFVVAAGNSGPELWTLGSPGAAPNAITVGAYSTVYDGVAMFSSRGPSATWYESHPEEFRRDSEKFSDDLLKPDCIAPGGGPVSPEQKTDVIYSGVTGWTNGMNDRNPVEPFDGMRGTSMATPHAAGVIALAVEHGLVQTAADVKSKLARGQAKNISQGYGLIDFERLAF
jgi:hypothetical protein